MVIIHKSHMHIKTQCMKMLNINFIGNVSTCYYAHTYTYMYIHVLYTCTCTYIVTTITPTCTCTCTYVCTYIHTVASNHVTCTVYMFEICLTMCAYHQNVGY